MSKNSSAKYYHENKEEIQNKVSENEKQKLVEY